MKRGRGALILMRSLIALVLALSGCAGPSLPLLAGPELQTGAAEVDITPPRAMRLAGTFQERVSDGSRDRLKARAFVFARGESKAAVVLCDLIGVPIGVSVRARERAARATGIPASHIAVAANRAPAGPLYFGAMYRILRERALAASAGADPLDFDYAAFLVGRVAEAVERADRARRPARLEAGVAKELALLVARDARGPAAALAVASGRAEPAGTRYSAGFAAAFEKSLREGASTDLVAGLGSAPGPDGFEPESRGPALGAAALALFRRLEPAGDAPLAVANERVDVPLRRYPAEIVEHARQNTDKVGSKELSTSDQARICAILHARELPGVLPLEVQVFRLGSELALVTLPGEVFEELGQAIRRASPFRVTLVLQLANDHPGAVPSREAFLEDRPRTAHARVEAGAGERLVESALRLLQELKP